MIGIGAAVAGDDMQLRHGHIKCAAVGVFQVQEFHLAFAQIHFNQAQIASNAVLRVHDRVAFAQFGQVAHHGFDVAGAFLGAFAPASGTRLAGVEVVFREQGQGLADQAEAGGQRRDDQRQAAVRAQEVLQRFGGGSGLHAELVQHLKQGFAPSGGVGAQLRCALGVCPAGPANGPRGRRRAALRRHRAPAGSPDGRLRPSAPAWQRTSSARTGPLSPRKSCSGGSTGRSRSLFRN